jgi:DNA polymerase III subunit delta
VKVKEAQIARALDAPDGKVRLYLLYGPDESGSRALAARLERAMGSDAERIDLEGATLKDDPARLSDEASAISLFGGKRFIRVTGGDECTPAVEALLEASATGDPVVMVAGALKPASALLKRVLDDPAVLACQNYKPEGSNADELAIAIGRTHGLRLSREVARDLVANTLGDRAVLEREIEKLALFLDAAPDRPRDAPREALDAIGAGLDEVDTGALIDAVMDGRPADVARELAALEEATSGPIPALRGLARRLLVLSRFRSEVEAGARPAAVMAASGKALFYKEKDSVGRQLMRWDAARLHKASHRIFAVEAAIKASGTAGEVLAANELIAIARVAERLR